MTRPLVSILFALTLSVGAFATQADASEGGMHMASLGSLAKAGHMGDWLSDLIAWAQQHRNGGTNGGSVPVPGTLLAFAVGFAGFAAWRAKRSAE